MKPIRIPQFRWNLYRFCRVLGKGSKREVRLCCLPNLIPQIIGTKSASSCPYHRLIQIENPCYLMVRFVSLYVPHLSLLC